MSDTDPAVFRVKFKRSLDTILNSRSVFGNLQWLEYVGGFKAVSGCS